MAQERYKAQKQILANSATVIPERAKHEPENLEIFRFASLDAPRNDEGNHEPS